VVIYDLQQEARVLLGKKMGEEVALPVKIADSSGSYHRGERGWLFVDIDLARSHAQAQYRKSRS